MSANSPITLYGFSGDVHNTVIIGIGNSDRADDAVGIFIADELHKLYPGSVFSESMQPAEKTIMELLPHAKIHNVLLIDAADFKAAPGSVQMFSPLNIHHYRPALSTHQVPMTLFVQLLEQAEKTMWVLGIQPLSLDMFEPMTELIHKKALMVIDEIKHSVFSSD
ncbi:hydrogenase maturation protease [bacterium]|nr:hydrogenase maturation protease [bacterium]